MFGVSFQRVIWYIKKIILIGDNYMGKIITRKRGEYWQYGFETANLDGKRSRIYKSGFKTKAEAITAGTKAAAEYNESGLHFIPSELSFHDFLDLWMDAYCNVNLKEVTITNYKKKLRLHIKPELGIYKLKALNPTVMQEFINKKAKQNYSRNTLSVIKGILTGSLSYAVKQDMIRYSPMTNVTLPRPRNELLKPRTAPHIYIPPERIEEIFRRFPEGSSTHLAMMLGYKAGLRLSEAFGLTWDDVDFEENTLSVNRQVQWHETKKVWYFSKPKYNSYRTIDIDQECMELLKREQERQIKAKDYYSEFYTTNYVNDHNHLNTNNDGIPVSLINVRENGEFITPRTMQHTSGIVHHKLNYPEFTFHGLRHTHATMLAENDVPSKYLQDRMGHKNLEITMRYYLHLTDKMKKRDRRYCGSYFQVIRKSQNNKF